MAKKGVVKQKFSGLNHSTDLLLLAILIFNIFFSQNIFAACGGNLRTWTGAGTNAWHTDGNWSIADHPDTTIEDALIVSAPRPARVTRDKIIGCLEVTNGTLESASGAKTLSITGDYFRAPNAGTVTLTAAHNLTIEMAGSGNQEFNVNDPVNLVNIANNSIVSMPGNFSIRTSLTFTGSTSGTVLIGGQLSLEFTGDLTIPSGVTLELESGASLTALGNIIVNGTLKLNAGSTLKMSSGKAITVNGLLNLNGTSGNVASIEGNGSVYWDLSVPGTFTGTYFRLSRVGSNLAGLSISGTVLNMDHGEFSYINSAGYAMTWQSGATLPANMDYMSFYDDAGYGNNKSINASAYAGSIVTLDQWAGLGCAVEGCAYENDPSSKVDWQTQTGTSLTLSANTNSGKPVNPVVAGAASDEFIIFAFNLNQLSASTDITSVKFTLAGTASASDVDYIQVFNQGASCQTKGAQIGSNLFMSGTPATATLTIPPSTVTTNGSSPACIHVYLKTTASAENAKTIGVEIAGSSDVVNSTGYSWSPTSGPPLSSTLVTISGDPTRVWAGKNNTSWRVNNNWLNGAWPDVTANCRIGTGTFNLILSESNGCQNTTLTTGGSLSFNSAAHVLSVAGSLSVQSSFSFLNATAGTITMAGSSSQTIEMLTLFPGHLVIQNTGTGGGEIVSTSGNVSITGNLSINDGTLRISQGHTVTIGGNITVASGATLDIEPGGTLKLGNGKVLTINTGGILEMIGNGQQSTISADGSNAYTVVVNGTIKASNYTFDHLGTAGVTINSGATIDATNYLQNGTFSYPVSDNTTLLTLNRTVPGHALSGMSFSMNGSPANSATMINIKTNVSPASGTNLSITSYSGDLGGTAFENETGYIIDWSGQSNNYQIILDATAPASLNQGQTYVMGRFGFQQNAGAVYTNMNITSLKLTLTGTGSSSDISQVKIYSDTDCDSAAGTLIGTGTFSGSPATKTFTGLNVLVEAGVSPPKRCIYVTFDISATANNSKTVGVQIKEVTDIVNDQSYTISGSTPVPRNLGNGTIVGSSTTWTGSVSTAWNNASNWSGGIPTSSLNCFIPSATNNPIISAVNQSCKSLEVTNGTLTINSGLKLTLYGSLTSTGTINNNGTIEFSDDGVNALNQTISWNAGTLGTIQLAGTAAASSKLEIGSNASLTINNLVYAAGTKHYFKVVYPKTLVLPNGLTLNAGTLEILEGATVKIGNGQIINVTGGYLRLAGTEQAAPQTLSNKAKITVDTAGTWGLNSSSGTIYLGGFQLDYMDTNGVRISGTTSLTRLAGGQFTNLSNSYASVKAIQFNTTGSIPATSTNVGWNWSPNNTYPDNAQNYRIVSSSGSGCNSGAINFTGWFGDWYENTPTFNTATKIDQVACTITLGASASPVSLLSFTATPYNGKVDLNWETALEQNHKGFNVYRANELGTEFLQINNGLVRNIISNTTFKGKYRFIDEDATNGIKYYYYIEDIGTDGFHQELHGPVWATPLAGLGNPPATGLDTNDGTNPDVGAGATPPGSTIPNPSYKDLGNGVVILAQTSTGLRLWIKPGTPTYSASSWNGSYEEVSLAGYSKTLNPGIPEILERVVLIEVNPWTTQASVTSIAKTDSPVAGHLLQPAPTYSDNGSGTLIPSFNPDATTYATNSYSPTEYVSVNSSLITLGNKKFLRVLINPIRYNPDQQIARHLTEAVVDIGLVSDAWDVIPPNNDFTSAPETASNTLKIHVNQSGMYELTYDQLTSANVDGPFKDLNISELRLYYFGDEVPLEIESADAIFNSGDKIHFYIKYFDSFEDSKNVVVLSNRELVTTGMPAERMQSLNADPTGTADSIYQTTTLKVTLEQNNLDFFSDPLGERVDHFFWKRIFAPYPAFPSLEYLDMQASTPQLDSTSTQEVKVRLYLKGNRGTYSDMVYQHHLGLYINNIPGMVAEKTWSGEELQVFTFSFPSSYFHPGTNNIRVKSLGDLVTAGDWDVILIDKMEVEYPAVRYTDSGELNFPNREPDAVIKVTGFSNSSIVVYDVTSIDEVAKLTSTSVTGPSVEGLYSVEFYTHSGPNANLARNYHVMQTNKYKTPVALELTHGIGTSLKDSSNQADFLIIGPSKLLSAVDELITHRQSQGLEVKAIRLDDIYNEFSNGMTSTDAIRQFVRYTQTSWSTPYPKYLLILGDATYDPKDHYGYANSPSIAPIALVRGEFYDYGSDNWYVAPYEGSELPGLAVGRIPTDDPAMLRDYVNKVIAYEDGTSAPSTVASKLLTFISDTDTSSNEQFKNKSLGLSSLSSLQESGLSTVDFNRTELGSDAATKQKFLDAFNNGSLILNFLGHGAEDRLASLAVFSNSDAQSLSNSTLPVMLTLNCLNGNFYDPDVSIETLGEKLILNPDGGAIAFIGSTSMTVPNAQLVFANAFYGILAQELGQSAHTITYGDIFYRAKVAIGNGNFLSDIHNSYIFFGDPALRIPSSAFTPKATPTSIPTPFSAEPNLGASKGGGGCSAMASDGKGNIPWYWGLLEYLVLGVLLLATRKLIQKIGHSQG